MRVVLDAADQAAARALLASAGFRLRTAGPDVLLVERAQGREVNQTLGRGGIWARQLRVEHASLEEAFLDLIGDAAEAPEATTEEVPDATALC